MKYVCDSYFNIIAIHDDNQNIQNLYPGLFIYQSQKTYSLDDTFVLEPYKTQDLIEYCYKQKCRIAYGGVHIIKNNQEYIFETTQDSITMCNSVLLGLMNQDDSYQVYWKVWQDDKPAMLALTKAQFQQVFSFGMRMINEAFAEEGTLDEVAKEFTEEQLADRAFIDEWKTGASQSFDEIDVTFNLDEEA